VVCGQSASYGRSLSWMDVKNECLLHASNVPLCSTHACIYASERPPMHPGRRQKSHPCIHQNHQPRGHASPFSFFFDKSLKVSLHRPVGPRNVPFFPKRHPNFGELRFYGFFNYTEISCIVFRYIDSISYYMKADKAVGHR